MPRREFDNLWADVASVDRYEISVSVCPLLENSGDVWKTLRGLTGDEQKSIETVPYQRADPGPRVPAFRKDGSNLELIRAKTLLAKLRDAVTPRAFAPAFA